MVPASHFFNNDTPKKHHLWEIWTKNHKGLRERVHLSAGVGRGAHQNGTEEQGKIIKS